MFDTQLKLDCGSDLLRWKSYPAAGKANRQWGLGSPVSRQLPVRMADEVQSWAKEYIGYSLVPERHRTPGMPRHYYVKVTFKSSKDVMTFKLRWL